MSLRDKRSRMRMKDDENIHIILLPLPLLIPFRESWKHTSLFQGSCLFAVAFRLPLFYSCADSVSESFLAVPQRRSGSCFPWCWLTLTFLFLASLEWVRDHLHSLGSPALLHPRGSTRNLHKVDPYCMSTESAKADKKSCRLICVSFLYLSTRTSEWRQAKRTSSWSNVWEAGSFLMWHKSRAELLLG